MCGGGGGVWQWREIRTLEEFEKSGTKTTMKNKHSSILNKINLKPHTKGLFISVPITCYIMPDFQQQQKIQCAWKSKKNTV